VGVKSRILSTLLVVLLLAAFAALVRPEIVPGDIPGGVAPDSYDYAYGAQSLLRGQYVVDWDGSLGVPHYPPGFSFLLVPAVALGGIEAAVWVSYAAAFVLGLLAALLAARLGHLTAAPLAVLTTMFVPAVLFHARLVMSDLPAAALLLLEAAVLAFGQGGRSAWLAGTIGGFLPWIRISALPLLVAGLVALTAYGSWRRSAALYVAGAALPIVGLGLWQLVTFGSPLTTTYQAATVAAGGSQDLSLYLAPKYVLGVPMGRDAWVLGGSASEWQVPNLVLYPLQLAGADTFLTWPGVGLLGLAGLAHAMRQRGAPGAIGRFAIATVLLVLALYLPYFWQSGRFMLPASVFLTLGAAAAIAHLYAVLVRRVHRHADDPRP
jgi:hypothetical protein